MVSYRGIDANPEKIRAVIEIKSPCTLKEIQSLTSKLAALNRYISLAMDKCHVFFQEIKKGKKIEWALECEEAFQRLKDYLFKAPLLSMLRTREVLYLYLVVPQWAISLF